MYKVVIADSYGHVVKQTRADFETRREARMFIRAIIDTLPDWCCNLFDYSIIDDDTGERVCLI